MKPAEFRYERPDSLADAIELLDDPDSDAAPLAGGQSLMPMMNFRLAQPDVLVDLNGIAELCGIAVENGHLRIGAMNRYSELASYPDLSSLAPLLAKALPHIAHSAIRNRGTIGGSLALADPAAELPAVMLALQAVIHVIGPNGRRNLAADGFFLGPFETALAQADLIESVSIPVSDSASRFGFHEVCRRHGDYAMAGAAVANAGTRPRIALFSVADRALRATGAEAVLARNPDDLDSAIAALEEIGFAGDLNGGPDAKRQWAGAVLRRAWAEATA